MKKLLNHIKRVIGGVGPGLFIVGYIIGTGSVTSMVVAGASYGMSLTWALLLSCAFSFVMIISIDRLTIVTGNTIIFNIKEKFGKGMAILIISGLMVTVLSSVSGVMGVLVEVTQEWLIWAGIGVINPVFIAATFLSILIMIFFLGRHESILKFMALMVGLMALNFVLTNFLIVQEPEAILSGLIPSIPEGKPHLVIAGIVGTTMAAVVFVSRSSLAAEKGWQLKDLVQEKKDALVAVSLTFFISAAIMGSAAGTLYVNNIHIVSAVDMVHALKPLVGGLAIVVLLIGIISAGLSSIFPNMVLFPWLISDYRHKERNLKSFSSRVMVLVVCAIGLYIPVFGGKPVAIMIASQAFSPLMMPLLIVFIIVMLNSKEIMGKEKISIRLNVSLGITLAFSIYMLGIAVIGYLDYFN